jgi:hypothetical protein
MTEGSGSLCAACERRKALLAQLKEQKDLEERVISEFFSGTLSGLRVKPRDLEVFRLRHDPSVEQSPSWDEIARQFGISRERARQLAIRAIKALCDERRLQDQKLEHTVEPDQLFWLNEALQEATEQPSPRLSTIFATDIDDLELSVRSVNSLKNSNIHTLGDLVRQTESQVLQVRNFGKKSLQEVSALLEKEGLNFGIRYQEDTDGVRIIDMGTPPTRASESYDKLADWFD